MILKYLFRSKKKIQIVKLLFHEFLKVLSYQVIELVQRVRDAVALKEPDRVPITPFSDIFFAPLQAGMTHKEAMYKGRKYAKAAVKVYSRYNWDLYPTILFPGLGKINDGLGVRAMKWPYKIEN